MLEGLENEEKAHNPQIQPVRAAILHQGVEGGWLRKMNGACRVVMETFEDEDARGGFSRQRVVLYEESSGRQLRVLGTSGGRKHSFRGAGLLPEGKLAWIWDSTRHLGDSHCRMHIVEAATGEAVRSFSPGGDPILDAAFSADGARFLCCPEGQWSSTYIEYDVASGSQLARHDTAPQGPEWRWIGLGRSPNKQGELM